MFIPTKAFLTKGVGRHKEKLTSFEMALRDAHLANFNLVRVSSIFPPQCELVDREVRPVAMEYELEDRYPVPIVEQMRALGFFGFTIPEQYGGSGLDEVCYAILMEELAIGWMSLAGILGTHMMTAWMILHYGTDEQRDAYLPHMATGAWHSGMALTEPGSGSDAAAIHRPHAPKMSTGLGIASHLPH